MFKFIHHFLLIIIVFIIQISSDDLFDCTGYEDDSFHPVYDADDCRHYWHCIYVNTVYMHAVKRVCPAGTEFDIHLRQCETSSEVNILKAKKMKFNSNVLGRLSASSIAAWSTINIDNTRMENDLFEIILENSNATDNAVFVSYETIFDV